MIRDPAAFAARVLGRELAKVERGEAPHDPALRLAGASKAGLLRWVDVESRFMVAARTGRLPRREARRALEWAWAKADPWKIGQSNILPHDLSVLSSPEEEKDISCGKMSPSPLERALSRVPSVEVPEALVGNRRLEPLARLLIALSEESDWRGDRGEFYISQRDLTKHARQPNRTTTNNRLEKLNRLGYVSRLHPGLSGSHATGEAAIYRWHDPPDPEGVVWATAENRYAAAAELVPTAEIPAGLADDRDLAAVARALLAIRAAHYPFDGEAFGASFGAIARLAGIDSDAPAAVVKQRLGLLCRAGYLTLARVGSSGTGSQPGCPSEWLWHDPPRPGETTWAGRSPIPP